MFGRWNGLNYSRILSPNAIRTVANPPTCSLTHEKSWRNLRTYCSWSYFPYWSLRSGR